MKKIVLFIATVVFGINSYAQQKVLVHHSGETIYAKEISAVDSIKLNDTYAKFKLTDVTNTLNFQKTLVDSLTFTSSTVDLDKIYVIYNGTDDATIINPYADQGVTLTASGGTVTGTATSGIANLEYNILGTTTNGSLTLATTDNVIFVMNNASVTNPSGAPIVVTGGMTTNFYLTDGTTNSLSDGTSSTKNGTIVTAGPIVFDGTGTLTVAGLKKHGIYTTSTITIDEGDIAVTSAVSDGLHSEGFAMNGGSLNVTSTADGIDAGDGVVTVTDGTITITSTSADVKAFKTGNNTITINGGTITLTVSGNQSKGISAKSDIMFNGGTIAVTLSGATVLTASGSGYDPSYPTAVKTDTDIIINGGTFTITATSTATGAKGFSANGEIIVNSGNITTNTAGAGADYVNIDGVADSYSTSSFSADTNITVTGGTINSTNSGSNGKGLSADVDVLVSGGTLTITNSGASGKGIKADGNVTFSGGNTTITVSGATVLTASGSGYDTSYPTGVKATGDIIVNSGTITLTGTSAATGGKGLSADGNITINDGTISATFAGAGAVYTNTLGTTDSYSSACITADGNLTINAGSVTTSSSGNGGKGLKADGAMNIGTSITSPTLNITTTGSRFLVSGTDYSHPKTIVADGAITIANGTLTVNSTDDGIHSDTSVTISGGNHNVNAISTISGMGEGVEAPIINFTGGVTNITASNDGINATYGTVAGGTESNDGSQLNISGGIVIVAGTDAIDSNGNITITGGTTVVCGPTNQPEEGIDFNGTFNMNGGTLISAGSNANMTKNFSSTSTQRTMYLKSNSQLAATSMIHIRTTAGVELATFKPKNGVYYFHFSSPNIAGNVSHQVYFGGSYTGGSFVGNSSGWGLYTGGTYSTTGATLKKTFTTSNTSTLNTQTF
ncbi:carbohydrate-binding domain-containing protein [Flavobacterium haoranii]|uniref:Carbohydrate-binding domain-containing protein n=1 Tax=Flavobacterium haoranii TaxID=683124 RepID=A0A1M6FFA9_9FLAO|nr:carbohydrate-binding domain-containing protein [Flavobacterium haoranii]SHI96337.1 protein of unknown function [Flavobacterium haoranii]